MGKVTYRDISDGMQKMVAPRTTGVARLGVGNDVNVGQYYFLDIDKIRPFTRQARKKFDEKELEELAHSIKEVGVCQPLSVIVDKEMVGFYEVVSGERRLRAAKMIGLTKIPCIIVKELEKVDQIALVENIQRSNLHPVELGRALKVLMIEKQYSEQNELAKSVGLSKEYVSWLLKLARLPDEILNEIIEKNITTRDQLRMFTQAKSTEEMQRLLDDSPMPLIGEVYDVVEKEAVKPKEIKKEISVMRIMYKDNEFRVQKNKIKSLDVKTRENLMKVLESIIDEIKSVGGR